MGIKPYLIMARIFITGSADGLGQMAAKALVDLGHKVVLHARHAKRGKEAMIKTPGAETVVTGDLSVMNETSKVAEQVNALGSFDAVIHNAGVYQSSAEEIFAVNTLAPYILTSLIKKPKRLIYLSSSSHLSGRVKFDNGKIDSKRVTYSDSKLHDLLLAFAMARKFPTIYSNAIDPGWVATKMGGKGAPDDLQKGFETQVWLAVSNDPEATVSGQYFYHKKPADHLPVAHDITTQDKLIAVCEEITGIIF
jgi:NAD(P)-dependent dehydrogenase (short-subunit alcohol dehydrogenase family)